MYTYIYNYIHITIYTCIYSIRFASPGGPGKMLWSPGTLAEFRKWHAEMCLRLRPQGHENGVAFDVHSIILEVFFVVLASLLCCFVAWKAPRRMKKLFWNHHRNPSTPKGDSRIARGRTPIPFREWFFIVFRILGVLGSLWHRFNKECRKGPKRDPPKPWNLCSRVHGSKVFMFATPPSNCWFWPPFWLYWESLATNLLRFSVFFFLGCFFWTGFMGE